ncbi:MAG: hypothetical protein K2X81_08205 [Candidatus Obscuribacterales bacterium]|nr:hypothetical protein [Candidatus Obscuribacterales bacterium]
MAFLPNENNFQIMTAVKPAELLQKANMQLKEKHGQNIVGEVSENTLDIYTLTPVTNPLLAKIQQFLAPQLKATVEAHESGSKLHISIGMNKLAVVLIRAGISTLAIMSLSITAHKEAPPNVPFALSVIAGLIIFLMLHSYAKARDTADRPKLQAFIESLSMPKS